MASNSLRLAIVSAVLIAGGALVWMGRPDRFASLDSVREVWADVLLDIDQFGLQLSRVSDVEEMKWGAEVASGVGTAYPGSPVWQPYVAQVGATVAAGVQRPGIHYTFYVLDAPEVNAFALPGGHVYVFTGLLNQMQSEAELAAVLGHEIAHVDLRHTIERYQYELKLRRLGLQDAGRLVEFARQFYAIGYRQYQEIEADAQGLRLSIRAGYDPHAAASLFRRMQQTQSRASAAAPAQETARVMLAALRDYFRTHPPGDERERRLNEMVNRDRGALAGKSFYTGTANYQQKTPKSVRALPGEAVQF